MCVMYNGGCPRYPVDVTDKDTHYRFDQIVVVVVSKSTKDTFDAWYNQEKNDIGWTQNLPKVYSTVNIDGTTPQDPEPDASQRWQTPHTYSKHYHPGASYEMRSEEVLPGEHGHQACYQISGNIITSGLGAGTADRSHWSNMTGATSHVQLDVLPFIRACQLDGNAVVGVWLNSNLNQAPMYAGSNANKYLEVRPILAEANRQIAPGTPCP